MVADKPSNNNSLTYGFLQTRTIKQGNISERNTSNAVAQYVLTTLTRLEVRKERMVRVVRSPNDEARGVAILSCG